VSAFSTLDLAIQAFTKNIGASKDSKDNAKPSKIALVLIGETCGNIIAGNVCLSAKEY